MRGRRHGGVAREGHAAHRPGPQLQRLRRGEAGWAARSCACRGSPPAWGCSCSPTAGPTRQVNGPKPVVWSPASSAWGAILNQKRRDKNQPDLAPPAKPFMLTPLVIAMPQPMAAGARLARHADRLRRHPRPRPGPQRLGRQGPSRVGPVQARQDQPQLLDERAVGDDRPVLRGDAARRPTSSLEDLGQPRGRRVRPRRRVVRRALRRHHAHVPQQLVPQPTSGAASLTYVSAVAVEEKSVIDYNQGNPDGDPRPGRGAAQAPRAARRGLPEGGHALLRQPVHRARRAVGRRPRRSRPPTPSRRS